jgi:hypothetical protein
MVTKRICPSRLHPKIEAVPFFRQEAAGLDVLLGTSQVDRGVSGVKISHHKDGSPLGKLRLQALSKPFIKL